MDSSEEPSSNSSLVGIIVPSVILALIGLSILAYLFVVLYKKLYWANGCCYCVDGGETPNDIARLTGDDASPSIFVSNESDESGYVRDENSSTSACRGSSDSDSKSLSPSTPSSRQVPLSSSTSFSQCSFFSVDETVTFGRPPKVVQTVSTGVQTEPVTISYAPEADSSEPTHTVSPEFDSLTQQHDAIMDNSVCLEASTVQLNKNLQTEQPTQSLIHFDNFSKFADYIKQQQCPPIIKPIVDNFSSLSSLTVVESTSEPMMGPISRKSSSSIKRKWNEEKEKANMSYTDCMVQEKVNEHADYFVEPATTHYKDTSKPFVSPTEENLKRQQKDLAVRIEAGCSENIPFLEQVSKSLEWIQILCEMLLGESSGLLTSFPENLSLTKYELLQCTSFLQDVQKSPLVRVDKVISLAQKLILLRIPSREAPLGGSNSRLIIGVDATPNHFGGYCVNLAENWIQFYIINAKDLPWKIVRKYHSDEFEMKNFMLALCIWHGEIEEHKTFSVYTDNNAVVVKNKYGCMVDKLVQHFVKCKDARVCNKNKNMHVNRRKDLDSFAKYIQPADDLSRWKILKCTDFLCKFYSIGIENVRGTHDIQAAHNKSPSRSGNEIVKNPFYNQVLHSAQQFVHSLESSKCFGEANQSSLFFEDLVRADTSTSTLSLPDNVRMQVERKWKKRPRRKNKRK